MEAFKYVNPKRGTYSKTRKYCAVSVPTGSGGIRTILPTPSSLHGISLMNVQEGIELAEKFLSEPISEDWWRMHKDRGDLRYPLAPYESYVGKTRAALFGGPQRLWGLASYKDSQEHGHRNQDHGLILVIRSTYVPSADESSAGRLTFKKRKTDTEAKPERKSKRTRRDDTSTKTKPIVEDDAEDDSDAEAKDAPTDDVAQ